MKLSQFFLLLLLSSSSVLNAQSTPDPSAAMEVRSTTQGFLPPRMTAIQRDAISSPANGLMIFNSSTGRLNYYDGGFWFEFSANIADYDDVVSSSGKTWLDRNLGADRVATASNDANAYGNLYQWGRNADGHQDRTSSTAAGPVASGSEGSNFITASSGDWLSVPDDTRWNGATKGAHDPCPSGYRVPTETEWDTERLLFSPNNAVGAYSSVLKLPVTGYRRHSDGTLQNVGSTGYYWSSTVNSTVAHGLFFSSSNAAINSPDRAHGLSVRCIKE